MFTIAIVVLVEWRSFCLTAQMQLQLIQRMWLWFAAARRGKSTDWQEGIAAHKAHIQDGCISRRGYPTLVAWSDSPCLAPCRDCGVQRSCTGSPPGCLAITWLWWCCGAWVYTVTSQWLWYWGDKKWAWRVAWKSNYYYLKFTCSFTLYF